MTDIQLKAISHDIYKEACIALHYEKAENCVFLLKETFCDELKTHMLNHLCMGLSRYGSRLKLHGIRVMIIPDSQYYYPCPYKLLRDFNVNKIMEDKLGGCNNGPSK